MSTTPPTHSYSGDGDDPLGPALVDFISRARWFGGKGRDFEVTDVEVYKLHEGEPRVSVALVGITYADGGSDVYQVPAASYAEPQDRLVHALIAVVEGRHVYDGLHDREANHVWLERFRAAAGSGAEGIGIDGHDALRFHAVGGHDLDLSTHSTLFSGEQSNSSVAFGDDALMKVFRRITPGVNPDIEIHEALSRAESAAIAELYGWLELDRGADREPLQLAMLQQFLRTASDGWDLALASARNLFAEAELDADLGAGEVGGDFAGESHRLGVAVAEVHALLAEAFPTQPWDAARTGEGMRRRLVESAAVVPALAEHSAALEQVFARLAQAPAGSAQRVHGDLHLGQTLRTSRGWKLVDFEGEPAKSLDERRLPDSPWRDVAGMLRSFDYAARSVVKDLHQTGDPGPQVSYRAEEWVLRNRQAFLDGYVEGRGTPLTPAEQAMIDAYEADKAVYEVVYEARNRPGWLDIPLSAIARIGASA